jgi:hypothetical protein
LLFLFCYVDPEIESTFVFLCATELAEGVVGKINRQQATALSTKPGIAVCGGGRHIIP